MLDLESAIKHCEEVAEELEEEAVKGCCDDTEIVNNCYECASEHRQLAEWLKELKDYKDARVGCEYCKYKFREEYERPCSLCQRNFVDKFERGEVNADEESE